jgi:hypothetical protein
MAEQSKSSAGGGDSAKATGSTNFATDARAAMNYPLVKVELWGQAGFNMHDHRCDTFLAAF